MIIFFLPHNEVWEITERGGLGGPDPRGLLPPGSDHVDKALYKQFIILNANSLIALFDYQSYLLIKTLSFFFTIVIWSSSWYDQLSTSNFT